MQALRRGVILSPTSPTRHTNTSAYPVNVSQPAARSSSQVPRRLSGRTRMRRLQLNDYLDRVGGYGSSECVIDRR